MALVVRDLYLYSRLKLDTCKRTQFVIARRAVCAGANGQQRQAYPEDDQLPQLEHFRRQQGMQGSPRTRLGNPPLENYLKLQQ